MPLSLEEAIAAFEGYGKQGTLATENNNPGNIIAGAFANAHGAIGENSGFAVFPNSDTGFSAMQDLLHVYSQRGYTIDQSIARWNGNGPNTDNYQSFVESKTGIDGDSKLSKLWRGLKDTLGSINQENAKTDDMMDGIANKLNPANMLGLSWSRLVALIIGVLCLGVGLMSLKPVQETVIEISEKAGKAAAIAA